MKKKHIYLILCFLWMLLIFFFSSQAGEDSKGLSDQVLHILEDVFHITLLHSSNVVTDTLSFFIRKAAHMSEYAILAILCYQYFRYAGYQKAYIIAFLVTVLYAGTDEFHQLFVEGRSGQLMDVGIDAMGAILGLSFQRLSLWVVRT